MAGHPAQLLGATTGGVWTRAAALRVLSAGAVRRFLEDGTWQVCWPGVYADGGHLLDQHQRAWAAVLAGGEPEGAASRQVACGRTAARLHGLPLVDDDDPATGACERLLDDVATTGTARAVQSAASDGVRRLRRHRLRLGPADVTVLLSGLRSTTVSRTVADCARLLDEEALACLVDSALHRHLLTLPQLADLVTARHGRRGGPALARVAEQADLRAESPAETLARRLLQPHLPGLEPQVRLWDGERVIRRFDLGDREVRLAVELDGRRGHAGDRMAARDHASDRRARALGWHVERATWADLRQRPLPLVARILAEHERARRATVR